MLRRRERLAATRTWTLAALTLTVVGAMTILAIAWTLQRRSLAAVKALNKKLEDIAITDEGPLIVEGNSSPDLDILQRFGVPVCNSRFGDLLAWHLRQRGFCRDAGWAGVTPADGCREAVHRG